MINATPPNDEGKPREGFPFELNGEKLFAPREKMLPPEILEIAWEMKILPFKPDKYQLVSARDRTIYKADDTVDLVKDDVFIAQPTEPTPVAGEPYVIVPR